ncbi:MAG: adenylosuccinate lyase [Acidimicrobiia bacterium]|nr:adenylosuccinate lyase [Acidimicrobiia bacterium]
MIERYTLPEMASVWSPQARLETLKRVEVLALEAWESLGKVPQGVAQAVADAPCPTPAAVAEREAVTNHDLAAFVDLLGEAAGEAAAGWVHYGLTSSDVLDTATGVQLSRSAELLLEALRTLEEVVRRRAFEHRDSYMIGRTHGIWAEPTTFGIKLAGWAFELARSHDRMESAHSEIAVGKISGAVGTYAHVPPEVERHVCAELGLSIEPASTQVTARDRHARYLTTLALVGASIERMATEIRHLQRSEVGEAREGFGGGQKGSSAMPHKRNPILSERMTGLARLLRGYAQVGLENVALWHERDISHSSAERVALPDASTVLHYMLVKFASLVDGLVVDLERMASNLEATNGLVFSQAVLLALVEEGLTRDEAYRLVQRNAMEAWDGKGHLRDLLADDREISLSDAALESCFSLERVSEAASVVFERLREAGLPQPRA